MRLGAIEFTHVHSSRAFGLGSMPFYQEGRNMSIFPAVLVATVMSASGPVMEHTTEFPNWKTCVEAELLLHQQNRKSTVSYRNPYGKTYRINRIQAYCRAK